jgi:hypothetical protein
MTHRDQDQDIDARLARLTQATERVGPSAGFTDRVLGAVNAPSPSDEGWWSDLPRVSRRLVPVLTLVAAGAVVWAVHSARDVDDALGGSFDVMEIEW